MLFNLGKSLDYKKNQKCLHFVDFIFNEFFSNGITFVVEKFFKCFSILLNFFLFQMVSRGVHDNEAIRYTCALGVI